MATHLIDYRALLRQALLGVVRQVLERAALEGLPGEHHFYLTFSTVHPDLVAPGWLLRQHPQEMTVVLQNQFEDLQVADELFSVTLRFGGEPVRLTIPFAALRGFVDPAAELGFELDGGAEPGGGSPVEELDGGVGGGPQHPQVEGEGAGTLLRFERPGE